MPQEYWIWAEKTDTYEPEGRKVPAVGRFRLRPPWVVSAEHFGKKQNWEPISETPLTEWAAMLTGWQWMCDHMPWL